MADLSATQLKIYEYLKERIAQGVPPSVREIGAAVGLSSTSSVQAQLNALERKGYISRDPLHKRSIKVSASAENVTSVPLVGNVAAGIPITAIEEVEQYIPYNGPKSGQRELFALRVKGESMINAGILNGDIAVIEKCSVAQNGEIVVALIGDEATVKTFYRENGHFRLQPENDRFEPIIVNEVSILGKLVSIIRYYN